MMIVAALYRFTPFPDTAALRPALVAACESAGIRGTLLLAPEGINGTISGTRDGIDRVLTHIRGLPGCDALDWKESTAPDHPFKKLRVRLKREIVTMKQPDVDPRGAVGAYVEPADWNALIAADDVAVIDTRNDYEVAIGSFQGAIDPKTRSFSEFPDWWAENAEALKGKRVAMFCTGGIRCEKSTSWLKAQGVEEVFHLRGGILKYLEEVPEDESLWEGACFVFDGRVSVGHGLRPGPHTLCYACRRPLAPEDLRHPSFEDGVSCARCIDEHSDADRDRFRERQRQIALGSGHSPRN
jgi:UPF0176 protein